jgi:iron complex outermembrane receptor protein
MRGNSLLSAFLCLLLPALAAAEDGDGATVLPEVLVTPRKWAEGELDVPQSMTVIPESALRDAGSASLRDATLFVPNATLVEFTARRLSFPFVRGIGSGQGDPAVATYVDGVPLLFGSATNLPLLNVERIEFLRGPQGTLYGRNALGGLIHVFTRPPPDRPEVSAGTTAGSHGLREGSFSLGAPLADGVLSVGLAGLLTRRDGFTENDFTGHEVDDRDTLFSQGQVLLTPDGENEIRLGLLVERTRDGGFALSDLAGLRDRPHHISQDFEGVTERDVLLPSLSWTRRGDAVDLVSLTSFQSLDLRETSDFDFSTQDFVRRRADEESRALVEEFRVSSPARDRAESDGEVELRWLAGLLAFAADSDRGAANEFRPGGVGIITPIPGIDDSSGSFRDRNLGLFGQACLALPGGVEAGAGLRYDYEAKDARLRRSFTSDGTRLSSETHRLHEHFDELLPRFDLGLRVSEEMRLYGYAARGFKAGGFNLDAPEGLLPYGPETSWTFEAGAKTAWFDGLLRFDGALFLIDWDDMQLSQFDQTVGGYVTNAGAATSRGLEAELSARPVDEVDLFASFGLTDTEFTSGRDQFGAAIEGRDLPFAPRTTLGLGAQWTRKIGEGLLLHLRGEYARFGTFHYDAGNRAGERFGLANFRLGVSGDHWRLEAWVRNAFDEEYVPLAFQVDPQNPGTFVGECGAPRTFGLTLTLEF